MEVIAINQTLHNLEVYVNDSSLPSSPDECKEFYRNIKTGNDSLYCDPAWDSVLCWPPVPAGQTVSRSCFQVFQYANISSLSIPPEAEAFRICDNTGQWLWGNWTNYTECLDFTARDTPTMPVTVSLILLVCSLISLFFLSLTTIIFFYFKSLHCSRLQVHRNLVLALIIHSLMLSIISLPVVAGNTMPSYRDINWLCKIVISVKMYSTLSSINWMFVEGMLLHSRITTSIFQKDAPFRLYYFLGWGIPLLLIILWCIVVDSTVTTNCWEGYGRLPSVWIVTGPMIGALVINLIFLVNIIRILVTKLKASSTLEIVQIRRAMKATALLFPLLGITHLLFCVNPRDDSRLEEAYMITNAALQSSQGIFVSILYCFMNGEVQIALRKAYVRAALRRNPNHRYTWRSRDTRTSQTSTYFSNCDTSISEASFVRPRSVSVYLMKDAHRLQAKSTTQKYDTLGNVSNV